MACGEKGQDSSSAFVARDFDGKGHSDQELIHVVMLGQRGVGKTSIIHRFLFNKFANTYTETIEDDQRQVISYKNQFIDVTVLDTSGKHQLPVRRKHAIENGQVFLLVYSVDNEGSFKEINDVCAEITSIKGKGSTTSIILVGNKKDKVDIGNGLVDPEKVNKMAEICTEQKMHLIETSAKDNTNVTILFDKVISIMSDNSADKKLNI